MLSIKWLLITMHFCNKLTQVNSAKYLGVIIDHKLIWIEHTSYVKSKISKGIMIMYKAIQFLSKHALLNLYHAC